MYILVYVLLLDCTNTVKCGGHWYLLLLVEICEYRKTPFASELGTPHNDGFTGRDGNVQVSWICLTNLSNQKHTVTIIFKQRKVISYGEATPLT